MAIKVVGKPTLQLFRDDKLVKEHRGKNAFNINVLNYNNIQTILDETTFYLTDTAYPIDVNEILFDGNIVATAGFNSPLVNANTLKGTKIAEESGTVITNNKITKTYSFEWLPSQAIGHIERIQSFCVKNEIPVLDTSLQLPVVLKDVYGVFYSDDDFDYVKSRDSSNNLVITKKDKLGNTVKEITVNSIGTSSGFYHFNTIYDLTLDVFHFTNEWSGYKSATYDKNLELISERTFASMYPKSPYFADNNDIYTVASSTEIQKWDTTENKWKFNNVINASSFIPENTFNLNLIKFSNRFYSLCKTANNQYSLFYLTKEDNEYKFYPVSKEMGINYINTNLNLNNFVSKNKLILPLASIMPVTWHNLTAPFDKTAEESMKMIYEIEINY